jgi:hypothetical protein
MAVVRRACSGTIKDYRWMTLSAFSSSAVSRHCSEYRVSGYAIAFLCAVGVTTGESVLVHTVLLFWFLHSVLFL